MADSDWVYWALSVPGAPGAQWPLYIHGLARLVGLALGALLAALPTTSRPAEVRRPAGAFRVDHYCRKMSHSFSSGGLARMRS
jgi:hypothetical protein